MSITVKDHITQIREKIALYDEANEIVQRLEDIVKRIDRSSKSNQTIVIIAAVKSISKWHSDCAAFIEKHIKKSSYSESITPELENVMDIANTVVEFINTMSNVMESSIFDPSSLESDKFLEIKATTQHILDNYNKFPYSCQCIDELVKLSMMIDWDKYEIDWGNFFSTWKSICKVEINIVNEYIDSIVIDNVPDQAVPTVEYLESMED